MNIARKIAMTVAAAAVSIGLLGMSAPAHADTSWGGGRAAPTKPVTNG